MIGDMEDEDAETQQEKFSALAEKVTLPCAAVQMKR